MLGASEWPRPPSLAALRQFTLLPLRQGFGAGQNACTAQERRGPKGPLGGFPVSSPKAENIDFNRPCQKEGHDRRSCPSFWVPPPKGRSTLRHFNARGRQSRPISAPSAALRAVALRNAAAAAVHDFRPQAGNLPAARRSGRIWKAACPRRRGTFCRHRIKGGIRFCRMPPFAHGFSLRGGRPRDTAVRAPPCPPRPGPPPGSMCR